MAKELQFLTADKLSANKELQKKAKGILLRALI